MVEGRDRSMVRDRHRTQRMRRGSYKHVLCALKRPVLGWEREMLVDSMHGKIGGCCEISVGDYDGDERKRVEGSQGEGGSLPRGETGAQTAVQKTLDQWQGE